MKRDGSKGLIKDLRAFVETNEFTDMADLNSEDGPVAERRRTSASTEPPGRRPHRPSPMSPSFPCRSSPTDRTVWSRPP